MIIISVIKTKTYIHLYILDSHGQCILHGQHILHVIDDLHVDLVFYENKEFYSKVPLKYSNTISLYIINIIFSM